MCIAWRRRCCCRKGLAIHVGLKHNSTLNGDAYLGDALIGRLDKDAEKVTPGPHAWDGSYTRADFEWKGHKWRVESAHDGNDLVLLVTPSASKTVVSASAHACVFGRLPLESTGGRRSSTATYIEVRTGICEQFASIARVPRPRVFP